MKILKRKDFVELPPGVIFSNYSPCHFSGLYVKAETWPSEIGGLGDFVEAELIGNPTNTGSGDFMDKCERMEAGESVPIDVEYYGGEGYFDNSMLYAVYEKEDIEKIISVLQTALKVS